MIYREFAPSKILTPYIETYWMSEGFKGEGDSHKILPDGCVDIIFFLNRANEQIQTSIIGTMTTPINVNYSETIQIFGVRFKPTGIVAFTPVSIHEFTDRDVELESVETLFCKSFHERLRQKQSMEEIITYTDNYLMNCLPYIYQPDKRIIHAVDLILLTQGRLSLSEAASEVCLSQRHFERKFKSAVGISPKTFAKITRFKLALRCMQKHPQKDLLSIAIECGYYDHTHLIKDFKRISGDTPKTIR